MTNDKKIQELEILVNITGDKEAEKSIKNLKKLNKRMDEVVRESTKQRYAEKMEMEASSIRMFLKNHEKVIWAVTEQEKKLKAVHRIEQRIIDSRVKDNIRLNKIYREQYREKSKLEKRWNYNQPLRREDSQLLKKVLKEEEQYQIASRIHGNLSEQQAMRKRGVAEKKPFNFNVPVTEEESMFGVQARQRMYEEQIKNGKMLAEEQRQLAEETAKAQRRSKLIAEAELRNLDRERKKEAKNKILSNIEEQQRIRGERKAKIENKRIAQETSMFRITEKELTRRRVMENIQAQRWKSIDKKETKFDYNQPLRKEDSQLLKQVLKEEEQSLIRARIMGNLSEQQALRRQGVSKQKQFDYNVPVTKEESMFKLSEAELRAQQQEQIRQRVLANIEKSRIESSKRKVLAEKRETIQNKINSKTTVQRRRREKILEKVMKIGNKERDKETTSRKKNNKATSKSTQANRRRGRGFTGFLGNTMLFGGAYMMGSMMIQGMAQKMIALGQGMGVAETDVLKGQAARFSYGQRGDVRDFDAATDLYSRLTGQNREQSMSRLGEITGALSAADIQLEGNQLSQLAKGIQGLSGGLGIDEAMAQQKMLGMLSGRISMQEAGLVGVQKSKDPNVTLNRILDFLEKNAVTASVMQEGTLNSILTRISSAPKGLFSRIFSDMPDQVKKHLQNYSRLVR